MTDSPGKDFDKAYDDLEKLLEAKSPESDFQYDGYVIPLDLAPTSTSTKSVLGFWEAVNLIVGSVIGSGIFLSPSLVLQEASGNEFAALGVWIFSGVLALVGAACYAELGTMIPESGGDLPYLQRAFGDLTAFSFSTSQILFLKPSSLSIIGMTTAEYTCRVISIQSPFAIKLVACCYLSILTSLNAYSTNGSILFQSSTTLFKLFSLTIIGYCGITHVFESGFNHSSFFTDNNSKASQVSFGGLALGSYSALWAYDGWNSLNAVTAEIADPAETLPKTLALSIFIVMISYVSTNLAYFSVLEKSEILESNTVAIDYGVKVFGSAGMVLISFVVVMSTIGAINASIFAGSRISVESAKKSLAPEFLSSIHPQRLTPANALFFQLALAILFLSCFSVKRLVNLYSILVWIFYLMASITLLVLRMSEPFLTRPFKAPLAAPIIFSIVAILLLLGSVIEAKDDAIAAFCFLGFSVPAYFIRRFFLDLWKKREEYQEIDMDILESHLD